MEDYSNAWSFGKAFNAAHHAGGNWDTFKVNDKLYNTNTADGGNYGQNADRHRTCSDYVIRYGTHFGSTTAYKYVGSTALMEYNDNITPEGDLQRRNYHFNESVKKCFQIP